MPADSNTSAAPAPRAYRSASLLIRGHELRWGSRTFLMGIVNLAPDSFSGDGLDHDPDAAARLACRFEAEGADLIDIGAESSRPGADELAPDVELDRLLASVRAIRTATNLPLFVDTYHAAVADAALEAGVDGVNDIHGLRRDPAMARVIAAAGCPIVAMHNQRGRPPGDVIASIANGFCETIGIAEAADIDPSRLILDPGFGFGWTPEQNLEMVRRLPELASFELPLLLGVSRKSTIGLVLDAPVDQRLEGTAALVSLGVAGGADVARVHDVAAMRRVIAVADATVRGTWRHESRSSG
jgi:dihydropteroate synthase